MIEIIGATLLSVAAIFVWIVSLFWLVRIVMVAVNRMAATNSETLKLTLYSSVLMGLGFLLASFALAVAP